MPKDRKEYMRDYMRIRRENIKKKPYEEMNKRLKKYADKVK